VNMSTQGKTSSLASRSDGGGAAINTPGHAPDTSLAEYRSGVARLPAGAQFVPDTVLVVSDLHLGRGQDRVTGRFVPEENFRADPAFGDFLACHDREDFGERLLVLNGDTFDFLRIDVLPKTDGDYASWRGMLDDLGYSSHRKLSERNAREEKYGLRTDDYKCIWKLLKIARGHPGFFKALAAWVAGGGRIIAVKGNHDVELYWPLVQNAIRLLIARAGDPDLDPQLVRERVMFVQAGFAIENVYIEHGHRFEAVTRVDGNPVLPGGTELNLPLGSFVNRYIVNRLEHFEPFLDNVKPLNRMLTTMVKRHPRRAFKIAANSLPFLRRAAEAHRWKMLLGFFLFFLSFLVPLAVVVLWGLHLWWPRLTAWIPFKIRVPFSTAVAATPWLIALWNDRRHRRKQKAGEDDSAEGIYGALTGRPIESRYPRIYGVMGHTHEPDAQCLPEIGDAEVLYLNTGTWIGLWSDDRPDLTGRIIHSFVRFRRNPGGGFRHEHLEWQPDVRRAEPSTLSSPVGGDVVAQRIRTSVSVSAKNPRRT